mgnify:CR=1 FL=1
MNLIISVFQVVAPVFLLAGIGFVWVKVGSEYRIEFVTQLAMTLSVPCLIFTALMKTEINSAVLQNVVLASVFCYLLITVAAFALVKAFGLSIRTFLSPIVFGNTGNIGLPVCLFAFGTTGFDFAVVIFAVMAIYNFTFGVWVISGRGSPIKVLKEPLVPAVLLGTVFLINGWQTPRFLTNTLELIGQMAIPLMLITLGVAIGRMKRSGLTRVFWPAVWKFLVCLICALLVVWLFNLPRIASAILILQVTTPVAVTSYLLAEKYGLDAESVAALVIVSTLLSVMFIPICLAFLI